MSPATIIPSSCHPPCCRGPNSVLGSLHLHHLLVSFYSAPAELTEPLAPVNLIVVASVYSTKGVGESLKLALIYSCRWEVNCQDPGRSFSCYKGLRTGRLSRTKEDRQSSKMPKRVSFRKPVLPWSPHESITRGSQRLSDSDRSSVPEHFSTNTRPRVWTGRR